MEGAVIGCVPYVKPVTSSSIPECFEDTGFVTSPEGKTLTSFSKCLDESKMLNSSSPDAKLEQQGLSAKLLPCHGDDKRVRLSLKLGGSSKREETERATTVKKLITNMRLMEEKKAKSDVPSAQSSAQIDSKMSRVPPKPASFTPSHQRLPTFESSVAGEGQDSSANLDLSKEAANDVSRSVNGDCTATNLVWDAVAAQTSNANSNGTGSCSPPPDSPQSNQDASESAKKRYLYDFRPDTHLITVKTKNGEKSFRCYVCGGIYQQKFSLKRHYLRNHIDFRYISENDISNCNIPIPNYFKMLHSSPEFKKSTNGRKKFKKGGNDIFLENNDNFLMPGLYRCHDCPNITFNTELELKNHYNMHPEAVKKKFQCDVCGASFVKKQILSRHLASHVKKKAKFECKKCPLDFSTQVELVRHSNSHSGNKLCKYCGKSLSTTANRKRHEALHLGLKPYSCVHCGMSFAQSKDLDRHLRKHHSELCHECPECFKPLASAESLETHLREKHGDSSSPKKPEISNNGSGPEKEVSKPTPVAPPAVLQAKKVTCRVCRRIFRSVYAMLKHKRQAHAYQSRKKRRGVRPKVGAGRLGFRKSPTAQQPSNESPAKRGRPRSPRVVEKYLRKNTRPGPRISSRREEELYREYYLNVAEQINRNILHHVDGRASQLSLKEYNFNDRQYPSGFFEDRTRLPWSHYNFPQWYDVDNALKTKGQEIKRPDNLSSQDEFLYDATGLAPARCAANSESQKLEDVKEENVRFDSCDASSDRVRKFIGKEAVSLILCGVCKETFNSSEEYSQHIVNNHPNVSCHYMTFEGDKESPPVIPPEMRQSYLSPVGFRFSCDVPPSHSEGSMKCTKCKSEFPTRTELHVHLTVCGNLGDSSSNRIWRKKTKKRIKNTMKHRMNLNPEHAILNVEDYKTPEKLSLDSVDIVGGKVSKSSDKPQLFKNGRLQTKSLSVDMNYFKTKPLKPSKGGVSKRGRKSYAFVSSMYRNATLQPSSSRECNECRILFPSLSALNMHMKCHTESQTEENSRTPPPAFTSENVSLLSRHAHPPKLSNKLTSVVSPINTSLKNTTINLFASPVLNKHQTNTFSRTPKSVACGVVGTKESTPSTPSQTKKEGGLQVMKSVDSPIDLSTNSCEKKVRPSNTNSTSKKTALQIAMDAIMKYSEKDESTEQKPGNEHISRLQETVEKLTIPTVSPILKPAVVKKVGRPRKLKKIITPSITLQGSSKSVFLKSDASKNSKPVSKLEAAVERLKNKVSSQEKRSPSSNVSESTNKESSIAPISHALKNSDLDKPVPLITQTSLTQNGEKSKNEVSSNTSEPASLGPDRDQVGTSLDLSNSDLSNQVPDPVIVEDKGQNHITVPASEKTPADSLNKTPDKAENHATVSAGEKISADLLNKTPESMKDIQKIAFEDKRTDQSLPVLPSAEFRLLGNTEKISPSSQGRCSPTFDSILKVINQKLHSEEESSQHDDTAISWLEDEKFEIPPPRSNFVVTSNASTELTPVKSSSSLLADISIPEKDVALKSGVLQTDISTISENVSTSSTGLLNGEVLKNTGRPGGNPAEDDKEKSDEGYSDIQASPKGKADVTKGAPQIPQSIISVVLSDNPESIEAKSPEKSSDLLPLKSTDISNQMLPSKDITKPSENIVPARKRPGRPRKNKVEDPNITEVTNKKKGIRLFNRRKENASSVSSAIICEIPIKDNITLSGATQNKSDISDQIVTDDNNVQEDAVAVHTLPSLSDEKSPGRKNKRQFWLLSNKPKRVVSKRLELPVRGRKKTKKMDEIDTNQSMLPKDTISTEFARNLATKIKEGLSNDINNSTNIIKAEVKKEYEYIEPSKKHSCPYCMLEFAYLTNFRRHLRVCVARTETDTQEPVPEKPTGNLLHLPKKDEVDYSMLNLYRHQSRQTQMLRDVEKSVVPGTPIKKYECAVCHRIYLNLFTFLQHKIVHNLTPQNSSESIGLSDSSGCKNDGIDISNSFLNEPTPESVQLSNESDLIEKAAYLAPSQISDESIVEPPKQISSIVTEAVKQIKNKLKRDIIVTSNVENTETSPNPIKSENFVKSSTENGNAKIEVSPVKRKRGRPFGWRKNANVTEDHKVDKPKDVQVSRKNSSLIYKRAGKLNSIANKSLVPSKFIAQTKKVILNKIGKTVKLSKPIIAHESPKLETNSGVTDAKPLKLDTPPTENPVKDAVKESALVYSFPSDDDFVEIKKVKKFKSLKLSPKSKRIDIGLKIQPIKRPRGRPPMVHSTIPEAPSDPVKSSVIPPSAAETPIKRRPGRPPKQLQSTAGPSQPSKSGSSSLHIRSGRRSAPMPNIDSSDSDCDIMKANSPPKKKVSKSCSVCKRKFLSTLALHRHIQIMHNRRIQNPGDASDLPVKVPKKMSPKSSTVDAMESDLSPKIQKKISPKLFVNEAESDLLSKFPKKTSPKLTSFDTTESDLPTKILKKTSPKLLPVDSIESDIPLKIPKKMSPKLPLVDGTDSDVPTKIPKKMSLKASSVDAIESDLPLKTPKKITLKSSSVDASELEFPSRLSKKVSVKSSSTDATELNLPSKISKKSSLKSSSIDGNELDLPTKIPKKTTLKSPPMDVTESADLSSKIPKKSSKSSLADKADSDLHLKIPKKKSPKSFPVDTPDGDNDNVEKGSDLVKRKLKICAICKSKFVTSALLRYHIQTFHSRKSEPMPLNVEIPADSTNATTRSPSLKPRQPSSPNRNSLSRQCRKSLPIIQKRYKKQPSEQIKKQKL